MFDLRFWILDIISNLDEIFSIYRVSVAISFVFFIFCSTIIFFSDLGFNEKERDLSINIQKVLSARNILLSNPVFLASFVTLIAVSRWPSLLPSMMNVDEGWFIAGAMKLLNNPVFWQSVDGGSSGPLNIYPLILPTFLGIKIEYASSRLIGLTLITASIAFLYYSLLEIYGPKVSRLSLIPLVIHVSLTTYFDYVNYIGEFCPIFLLSLGLFLTCKYYSCELPIPTKLIFFLGFTLGLTPYAKMQSVPISFAIFGIFLHILYSKKRSLKHVIDSLLLLSFGSVFPSIFTVASLMLFSAHDAFWKSYIQQNLLFYSTTASLNSFQKLMLFVGMLRDSVSRGADQTMFLYILTIISCLSGIPYLIGKKSGSQHSPVKSKNIIYSDTFVFVYYSVVFLISSCFVIVKPGNPYAHYLLFLIVPSGFLIGVFLGESIRFEKNLVFISFAILILSSSWQVAECLKSTNEYLDYRKEYLNGYTRPIIESIHRQASVGDQMAVWGWAADLYIESGLIPATRDVVTLWQINKTSLQEYYLKRYLNDLSKSKPRLFVDVVAPGSFGFIDRQNQAHEAFPEISEFVQKNYRLVEDVNGIRIFVRN
jgi:hypothetical protein